MLVTSRPQMLFSLNVQHRKPIRDQTQQFLEQIGSTLQDRGKKQGCNKSGHVGPPQSAKAAAKEADSVSRLKQMPRFATCVHPLLIVAEL